MPLFRVQKQNVLNNYGFGKNKNKPFSPLLLLWLVLLPHLFKTPPPTTRQQPPTLQHTAARGEPVPDEGFGPAARYARHPHRHVRAGVSVLHTERTSSKLI